MRAGGDSPRRFLMLGPATGWHADQLQAAAQQAGHRLEIAAWETLSAAIVEQSSTGSSSVAVSCDRGDLACYDAVLTRTMPAGSMEQITFRLATLHAIVDGLTDRSPPLVNPPRSLEWSIDKFASLAKLAAAGYPTPSTRLVQSRGEAMQAFDELGGDCVVKPIFGGEGRGVMRISDPQLAWHTFSTLDQLNSVLQIQCFVPPGGSDKRMLVIGERVFGMRRVNSRSFRSNVAAGANCYPWQVDDDSAANAFRIARLFGLVIASVDVIENDQGPEMYLEVNAIPGWKGAQSVVSESIAQQVIETLVKQSERISDE